MDIENLSREERITLLTLCEKGYKNPRIGDELCKGRKSVEKILTVLFEKYEVSSREELIIKYWRWKCG